MDYKNLPDTVVCLLDNISNARQRVSDLEAEVERLRAKNREFVDAGHALMSGWKGQADEWDRFWDAMGCKSAEITVDDAIAKWKALEAEVERVWDDIVGQADTIHWQREALDKANEALQGVDGGPVPE